VERDVRDRLVRRFRRFAESEAPAVGSPVYARMSAGVVAHDELLSVLDDAPERQQRPTTFFAAVQDVLLRGIHHPLRDHYPRLTGHPAPDRDPTPDLLDFVRTHREPIVALAATRGTQTNEVLRSVGLAPALAAVAEDVGSALSVLEVGASAGLNLRLDRYGYRYVDGDTVTEVPGELTLETEVARGTTPPAHLLPPPILDRVGLDLAPIDVTDEDDVRWLRACLWPEHTDRAVRLDAALDAARDDPPRVVQGDMLADLAATIDDLEPAGHLVIFHCVAMMYLPQDLRTAWRTEVVRLSRQRPIDVVGFEDHRIEPFGELFPSDITGDDAVHGSLVRSSYRDGRAEHRLLGRAHMHGRWVGWQAA
jgi:hypothetical protein